MLYLVTDAEMAALSVGTEYRVLAERAPCWQGKSLLESKVALVLTAAPKTYPNSVPTDSAGCIAEWRKVEAKPSSPLATVDAAELSAAIAKLRETPEGEARLTELVVPFLVEKAV